MADQILRQPNLPQNCYYMAANALRSKILYDFHELPDAGTRFPFFTRAHTHVHTRHTRHRSSFFQSLLSNVTNFAAVRSYVSCTQNTDENQRRTHTGAPACADAAGTVCRDLDGDTHTHTYTHALTHIHSHTRALLQVHMTGTKEMPDALNVLMQHYGSNSEYSLVTPT